MARKDEFEFDDLDFNFDSDFDMKPPKRSGVIGEIKYQLKRKSSDMIKNPFDYIKKVVKYSVPDKITNLYDKLESDYTFNKEKIDKRSKENKGNIRDLLNAKNALANETFKSVFDKIETKVLGKEENEAYKTVKDTTEDVEKKQIDETLSSIFVSTRIASEANFEGQRKIAEVTQQLENQRHEQNVEIFKTLTSQVNLTNQFNAGVTERYYKKSLEIQLKSFFALSNIAKSNNNIFETQKAQLDAIIRNTSEPDISKMSLYKQAKKKTYESLINGAGDKLLGKRTTLGKLLSPLAEQSGAESSLGMISSMFGMLDDSVSLEDMIVDMVSDYGIEKLSQPLKNYLTTKLKDSKNPKIQKIIKAVEDPSYFKEISKKGTGKASDWLRGKADASNSSIVSGVYNKLEEVVDKFQDYINVASMPNKAKIVLMTGKKLTTDELYEGVHYDIASRRSIVEVIPRYLSMIHQELNGIRTGKLKSEVAYDQLHGTFTTADKLKGDVKESLKKATNYNHSDIITSEILGGSSYKYNNIDYNKYVKKAIKMTLEETGGRYEGKILSDKASNYLKSVLPDEIYTIVVKDLNKINKEINKNEKTKNKLDDIYLDKEGNDARSASEATRIIEDIVRSNPYAKEYLLSKGYMKDRESGYIDLDHLVETFNKDKDGDEPELETVVGGFTPGRKKKRPNLRVKDNVRNVYQQKNIYTGENLTVVGVDKIVDNTDKIYEILKQGISLKNIEETNTISKHFDELNNNLKNVYVGLNSKINAGNIKETSDEVIDKVNEALNNWVTGKKEGIKNKGRKILNYPKKAYRLGKIGTKKAYKYGKKQYDKIDFEKLFDNVSNFANGVYQKGKNLVGTVYNKGKDLVNSGVKKMLGIYNGVEDVYVVGETEPRLLKILMSRGDYYFDQHNHKPIDNVGDIKGPVIDREGNIVLTEEDIKKGLVDKNGNEFKNIAVKGFDIVKTLVLKGIEKGLPVLSNILKSAKNKSIDIFGYLQNKMPGMFDFLKNVLKVPFSIFGSFKTTNIISSKIHNRLVEIRDMLNIRLRGKKRSYNEGTINVDENGNIVASASSTISGATSVVNKVVDKVTGKETENTGDVFEDLGNTVNNVKDAAKKTKEIVTNPEARKQLIDKIKGKFKDSYDKVRGKKSKDQIRKEMSNEAKEENVKIDETIKNIDAYTKDNKEKKSIRNKLRSYKRKPVDKAILRDYQIQRTAEEVSDDPVTTQVKEEGDTKDKKKNSIFGKLLGLLGGIGSTLFGMSKGIFKLLFMSGNLLDVVKTILMVLPGAKYLGKGLKWIWDKTKGPGGKAAKWLWDKTKGLSKPVLEKSKGAVKWGAEKVFTRAAASAAARTAATSGAIMAGEALAGGSAAAATAGAVAATGGTAAGAGFLGLTPVGWVILGAAAVGVGSYFAYKYYTRDNVNDIDELRYYQYGLGDKYKTKYHLIKTLENIIVKGKIVKNGNVNYVILRKHAKEISQLFDVDMRNKTHIRRFNTWLVKRFFPVYNKHNDTYISLGKDINVTNTDNIPKEKLKEVLVSVKVNNDILKERISPFKDEEYLVTYANDVILFYNSLLKKYKANKKFIDKNIKDNVVSVSEQVIKTSKADVISEKEKEKVKAEINNLTDKANSGKVISASMSVIDKLKKFEPYDYARGYAYGLNDYDKLRIVTIRHLEEALSSFVIVRNNKVSIDIPEEMIIKRIAPYFGLTEKSTDINSPWAIWFKERFLPMYSTFIGIIYKHTKISNFIKLTLTKISNNVVYEYLTALKSMSKEWNIKASPWTNYELNTNPNSLDQFIKYYTPTNITDIVVKAEVTSKTKVNSKESKPTTSDNTKNVNSDKSSKPSKTTGKTTTSNTNIPGTNTSNETSKPKPSKKDNTLAERTISLNDIKNPNTISNTTTKDMIKLIREVSKLTGTNPDVNLAISSFESYDYKDGTILNPNAVSPTGATGLYQFTKGTWNDMLNRYGDKYNIPLNTPRTDARANAIVGALFIKENSKRLNNTADVGLLEPAHMAPAYAGKLQRYLKTNPNLPVTSIYPDSTIGPNKGMFVDKSGRYLTLKEFYENSLEKVGLNAAKVGVDVYKLAKESNTFNPEDNSDNNTINKTSNGRLPAINKKNEKISMSSINNKSDIKNPQNVKVMNDAFNLKTGTYKSLNTEVEDKSKTQTNKSDVTNTQVNKPIKKSENIIPVSDNAITPTPKRNIKNKPIQITEQPKNLNIEISPKIDKISIILEKSLETQMRMLGRLISIDKNTLNINSNEKPQQVEKSNNSDKSNLGKSIKMPDSIIDIKRSIL